MANAQQKAGNAVHVNGSMRSGHTPIDVQYLIILSDEDSFCDGVDTFNRLLQVDSAISLKSGRLTHMGEFTCDYRIAAGEVTGRGQRYFQLHLSVALDEEAPEAEAVVNNFIALLKAVRAVASRTDAQIETLWDGVSFYFSRKAYPVVYRVENTMRKLIANFMLITVGKEWVSETSPAEIREALAKSKRKDYVNVLHSVDFIHLVDFLTKPYTRVAAQDLYSRIKSAKTPDDLEQIRAILPASNWQRYFSSLVKCEDTYLQKRWTDMYDLRCKVAHNAILSRNDYDRINQLSEELLPLLEDALRMLPQVNVPGDERETVAENAATTLNSLVGDFIGGWRSLERHLLSRAESAGLRTRFPHEALSQLMRANAIDAAIAEQIRYLTTFRNHLVHATAVSYSEVDVREKITMLLGIIEQLNIFSDGESMQ